jgi:RNase P subunit RPR2
MFKMTCVDCRYEWISSINERECPSCSVERMVQSKIRQQTQDWVRRQERARALKNMPVSDRDEMCDNCELPLRGNAYYEVAEDGERQQICDSCGHAHRVPCPPMMYMMNEKDWRSKY